MKGSVLLAPQSRKPKGLSRAMNCNDLITDSEEPFFSGSFTIPPTPQKSATAFPVQKLINYLTRNRDSWDRMETKKLNLITHDVISRKDDSELLRILRDHGWNGYHYSVADDNRQDAFRALLQELSNLYLKQKASFFANKLVDLYGTEDSSSAFSQLASFSPNLLLHYLNDRPIFSDAQSFSFTGACMLVDISGFSKFSGSMCLQGVSGLDGLREITNGFLGHFVRKVYEFDGDVMAFAGDALICIFHDQSKKPAQKMPPPQEQTPSQEPSPLPSVTPCAAYRALECACLLRTHRNDHLSTHIAVSYGEMHYAILGGTSDQWIGVVNGPCVSELSDAITLAGSQEVVATQQCIQHALEGMLNGLQDRPVEMPLPIDTIELENSTSVKVLKIHPLSPSNNRGKRAGQSRRQTFKRTSSRIRAHNADEAVLMERLTSFVPRPILSAVYSGTLNYIGELRQVTTLFLSLDSYHPDANRDPITLQSFVQTAQQTLIESGGFLRQFLVDDKGCVLIAMWGTPSYTYSNNCCRAVHCAVLLRQRTRAIGHQCSIGITTGIVFCGCVGILQRRDYVGIGSDVNMAARLMSKAHGRILIDETTLSNLDELTRGMLAQAEEMQLKGALTPVVPYEYVSDSLPGVAALDAESTRNQMLKRNVMTLIAKRLDIIGNDDATRASTLFSQTSYTAYFTILLAPLGNGNFAAEYFRHCARKRGIQCFSVAAQPSYKYTPYNVIKQIFLELVGHEHFVTEQQQRFVIDLVVNQAYAKSREHERINANISMQLLLGVEWISEEDIEKFNHSNSPIKTSLASPPSQYTNASNNSMPTSLNHPHVIRRVGDLTFYKVMGYLLKRSPTALVIENAQYCDELSWNELRLILLGRDLNISTLITMKANNSTSSSTTAASHGVSGYVSLYERFKHTPHARSSSILHRTNSSQDHSSALGHSYNTATISSTAMPCPPHAVGIAAMRGMSSPSGEDSLASPSTASSMSASPIVHNHSAYRSQLPLQPPQPPPPPPPSQQQQQRAVSQGEGSDHLLSETDSNHLVPHESSAAESGLTPLLRPFPERGVDSPGGIDTFSPCPSLPSQDSQSQRRPHRRSHPFTRFSSFLMSRMDSGSPGSFYVSGSSSVVSSTPRTSLGSISFDSFQASTSSSPNKMCTPERRRPSLGSATIFTTPTSKQAIFNPAYHMPSTAKPMQGGTPSSNSIQVSPFKETAAKFGLDFIPTEACRFILDSSQTTIVKIAGLTDEEVHGMLCSALGVEHISADLVKLVLDISSGNAYWCKQIVRFIKEQGVETMERTIKFGLSRHNPLKLLILLRLERLSTEQQLVLKVASIIGEEFSESLLATLLPKMMQVNVSESLQALIEHDFLCKVQEYPVELYGFQNQIIQDTLYELLPPR